MVSTVNDAFEILNLHKGACRYDILESFKKLALKWHPDKNKHSEESFEKFKKLCCAYLKIHDPDQEFSLMQLNESQMFNIFEEAFLCNENIKKSGSSTDISSEEDDDDNGDIKNYYDDQVINLLYESSEEEADTTSKLPKTTEEAQKNAEMLLAEEEKEKKKIEKRRAKKQRRKQKKKLEKELAQQKNNTGDAENNSENKNDKTKSRLSSEAESESEEELDPNCAFVANIANKSKSNNARHSKPEKVTYNDTQDTPGTLKLSGSSNDPVILQSRKLAIRANQMASIGKFAASIELFSEAIKFNPQDYRFYGNRSYCYDKEQQYEKALKDAEKAISLNPDWPKNYYRKGRALMGLKQYAKSENAFLEALKLDNTCKDAEQELLNVRIERIMEMGFTRHQAVVGIQVHGSVETALEVLLSSKAAGRAPLGNHGDLYFSDDEELSLKNKRASGNSNVISDIKMDPSNPEGFSTIWIGNVSKDVTEPVLKRLFLPFGDIQSLRLLPDKFCAFINYKDKNSAGMAMKMMQNFPCGNLKLLIRFPNRAPTNPTSAAMIKKPNSIVGTKQNNGKVLAPVNGNECFFWRQGGCVHGKDCRFKHVVAHKGIDKKQI